MVADNSGDQQEFEEEVLPHLHSVYRVALGLAGSAARAEGLAYETMLKAFHGWPQCRGDTSARVWLLTILRQTFVKHCRTSRRTGASIDIAKIQPSSVVHNVPETDPEGQFLDQIVDEEVLRALDALPDELRETLVLSDLEGLPYTAIAKITDIPIGTVKSRLFRARQALLKVLYDYACEMGYIREASRDDS